MTESPQYLNWPANHVVSRNCKRREYREIEVKRYNDGSIREIFLILFLVISGFILHDVVKQEGMLWYNINFCLHHEEIIEKYYFDKIYPLKLLERNKNDKELQSWTLENYKKRINNPNSIYYHRIRKGRIIMLTPLFLFILYGYPNFRPVRYDPIRRIIYLWSFGRFCIKYVPPGCQPYDAPPKYHHKRPKMRRPGHEALHIFLPYKNNPGKTWEVDMGMYYPVVKKQSIELETFLRYYMCYGADQTDHFARTFDKPGFLKSDIGRWITRFSLFPTIGYNKKKTERAIEKFFEEYNIKDMRKWYLEHPDEPGNPLTEDRNNCTV